MIMNCLTNEVRIIKLPKNYNKKISAIPKKIEKIICSKDYEYINDFIDLKVETY